MNTKEEVRSIASEVIAELTATVLITRDNLIQARNQLNREIKRIEDKVGKENIKKSVEGM